MDYGFRVIPFQLPTSTGNFDVTVASGYGSDLTPKFVMFFAQRSANIDTITSSELLSIGAVDGTNQMAGAMMSENGQLTASNDSGVRTSSVNAIEITGTGAQGLEAEATFVSFAAGKVTLNFAVSAPSGAYRTFALFGFGTGLTAAVSSFTGNATENSSSSISGLSFQPDGAIVLSWNRALTNPGAGQDQGMLSIGFAGRLPSTTQACTVVCREDRKATNTSSGCLSQADRAAIVLTSSAGTVSEGASLEVTAWPSDGITFTTRGASVAVNALVVSFSTNGRRVWAGLPLANSDTTGAQSFTNPGFRPRAMLFAASHTETDGTIDSGAGGLSIGAVTTADGAIEQALISGNFEDAQTAGAAQSLFSASNVVDLLRNATTHEWIAAFTSFDAQGWTHTVSTASTLDELIAVLAIEDTNVYSTDTEQISDGFAFLVSHKLRSADTEQISDASVFVVTSDRRTSDDIEQISDTFVLKVTDTGATLVSNDTENITEQVALLVANILVSNDTENISDNFVFAVGDTKTFTDTEHITDGFVLVQRAARAAFEEIERITDTAILILGRVLVSGDTVTIVDQFNSGAGLRALKRTLRGSVLE